MRIASANVQLHSSHLAHQRTEVSARLAVSPDRARHPTGPSGANAAAQVRLSHETHAAREAPPTGADFETIDADPRMEFLKAMIEYFTGRPARTISAEDLARLSAPETTTAEPSSLRDRPLVLEYDLQMRRVEFERVAFEADGTVQTTDGRTIRFSIAFSMERRYAESIDLQGRLGEARVKDPLMLDFAGPAAALSDARFAFDLDADGRTDSVPLPVGGRGLLAFDRDGNGRIDDGRELFGPTLGDGFAELAGLDSDGNGWIDEADPAFARLRIWRPAEHGDGHLDTLDRAGVGALHVGRADTPFTLRGTGNETLGRMRASGVYLREEGGAGTISQVDLSV